jgi:hypothetical protein
VGYDPFNGDLEGDTWRVSMGRCGTILLCGRTDAKGLSIGKRQGHAGDFHQQNAAPADIPSMPNDVVKGSTSGIAQDKGGGSSARLLLGLDTPHGTG